MHGVCILDYRLADHTMKNIAREINHSETAFLIKNENSYYLRWFTPKTEVKICGHATLATAHVLYELGLIEIDKPINFNTKSGLLTARKTNDNIELNFPQLFVDECQSNEIIEKAFDIEPIYTGKKQPAIFN